MNYYFYCRYFILSLGAVWALGAPLKEDEKVSYPLHDAATHGLINDLMNYVKERKLEDPNTRPVLGLDEKDENGATPLHVAIHVNQHKVVQFLCQQGVDVTSRYNFTLTIKDDGGNETVKHNVNVDFPFSITPLGLAMDLGANDTFEVLLRECANVGLEVGDVNRALSPLHFAAENGLVDSVKFLLNLTTATATVDVNAADEDGRTPLMLALNKGHLNISKLLMKNNSNVYLRDKQNYTALHFASASGIVKILPRKAVGRDVNTTTANGDTPLHLAAKNGRKEACKFLLDRKADPSIVNNLDMTAQDTAKDNLHLGVFYFLKDYNKKVTSFLNTNGELEFVLDATTLSSSRIENYVKFIKEEPFHTDLAGKALEDMKKIFPEGSKMESTYKTLDEHLQTAKNHSLGWDHVFEMQQNAFMSVKSFGQTFLSNFRDLEKTARDLFKKKSPEKIEAKVNEHREELKGMGYSSLMITVKVKKFKETLGVSESYDEYLGSLVGLLSHLTVYANTVVQESKNTSLALREFSANLTADKGLFKADRKMLESLKTESKEVLAQKMAHLARFKENAGQYEEAIGKAIQQIEEWQSQHRQLLYVKIGIQSFPVALTTAKGILWLVRYGSKKRIDHHAKVLWKGNPGQGLADFHYANDRRVSKIWKNSKNWSRADKILNNKWLRRLGYVADFVGLGLSVYELLTTEQRHKTFLREQDNVKNFTELLLHTTLQVTGLADSIRSIEMTEVQRKMSLDKLENCIRMVTGAIEESELLSQKWLMISSNLRNLANEAENTKNTAISEEEKKEKCNYVKNHLDQLKDAWDQVSLSAFEIKRTLPSVEEVKKSKIEKTL